MIPRDILLYQQLFRTHYVLETGIVAGDKGTFSSFRGPGLRGTEASVVMQKGRLIGMKGRGQGQL